MDGWIDRWTMAEWISGLLGGWRDGWTDERMDAWIDGYSFTITCKGSILLLI